MPTGATGQLGLALPVQGELSGTWGDTVNNGITQYTNIAIAGTLSFADDGAITLANTTGDATASNIGATTAQYMVIRITGTQSVTKVITGPSYSKLYMVDHAGATSAVTFKASGQTGVTVAVGEKCFVYYNGTDYVKVSSSVADGVTSVGGTGTVNGISLSGTVTSTGNLTLGGALTGVSLTSQVSGILPVANGGTATATPALVAGSGVTISGTWPNQTINATGTGGTVTSVTGSGNIASSGGNTPNITFTGTLPVSSGGTGASTLTANNVLLGNGTSALQVVAPSTAGNILTSNGTSWVSSTPSTGGATGSTIYLDVNFRGF
jgi:hypothetical protein